MEGITIKAYLKKICLFLSLILLTTTTIFPDIIKADEEEKSIESIEEKLLSITEEEKEILEYLFIQVQEIEEIEREERRLNVELEKMKEGIENLEGKIKSEELSYYNYKQSLKQVLQTYQRMGPGSYIEIILSSNSMGDLFKRINTLRDLTKGTGKLLETLDSNLQILDLDKQNLGEALQLIEAKKVTLQQAIEKKYGAIKDQEEYLESLRDDKEDFLERLEVMNGFMIELKSLMAELSVEFSKLIEDANFPDDAIKLELTLSGLKGSIIEEDFNRIIYEHKGLPEMYFKFKPGEIQLEIPENKVYFSGDFVVLDGKSLKYEIREGSIYDMKLEQTSIEDLFSEGDFILNLEAIVDKNTIKSIESKNGYIDLMIGIKLF